MQHAVNVFGGEVEFLDCATSEPAIGTLLENLGFYRARIEHPTVVCRDSILRRRIEALRSEWTFTKGDQDWDQVVVR